jgi:predicted NAD/FAD-dependent oxidoreductase
MQVVVVGAGLSGLLAGATLSRHGHEVVLLDKGRSPGGRLATRRMGGAVVDHGAQFFTVRTPTFAALVRAWEADGVVRPWCHGFGPEPDGHARYRAGGGMNALAKHLAQGLDVRAPAMAFAVRRGSTHPWSVALDDGTEINAHAVVVTTPLPQAYALLVTAGVDLPEDLRAIDYHRTLALLAVLDRPAVVPGPGGVQAPGDGLAWVGDNSAKGISDVPALTVHASPAWSLDHWEDGSAAVDGLLRDAARPWLGDAEIIESQVKRWRFATPVRSWPDACWRAPEHDATLVLAGDAFGGAGVPGPSMEAAALSGLAAAAALGA